MEQKKPNTILKDHLIEETAVQMELPILLVQDVISFQGEDAAKATHHYNEIEFSGFGKFLLSMHRTNRKIIRMEKKIEEGRVKEEDLPKFLLHLEELKKRTNV